MFGRAFAPARAEPASVNEGVTSTSTSQPPIAVASALWQSTCVGVPAPAVNQTPPCSIRVVAYDVSRKVGRSGAGGGVIGCTRLWRTSHQSSGTAF